MSGKYSLVDVGKDMTSLIADKLNDKSLMIFCRTNKYTYSVCNEDYFHRRTLRVFPCTVSEKRWTGWKKHYWECVYYVCQLRNEFRYKYIDNEDKHPGLLYAARKIVRKKYTHHKALIKAIEKDNLQLVKYVVTRGANIRNNNNQALKYAIYYGNSQIIKYLKEQGVNTEQQSEDDGL